MRVSWKETLYKRQQFTRLETPPFLRRPLPQRVAPLLATTLADVRRFLTHHFPVQRLRSMAGSCAAEAVGCGVDTGFRGMAARLPILPLRLLIDGDEGMRQGTGAAAVLHALTPMPIHDAGYVSLTRGAGARTPQQPVAEKISATTRATPAVLFIPHADLWVGDPSEEDSTDLRFFEAALRDVPVGTSLLVWPQRIGASVLRCWPVSPAPFLSMRLGCPTHRLLVSYRQGVPRQVCREAQARCAPASRPGGCRRTDECAAGAVDGLERRRDGASVCACPRHIVDGRPDGGGPLGELFVGHRRARREDAKRRREYGRRRRQ